MLIPKKSNPFLLQTMTTHPRATENKSMAQNFIHFIYTCLALKGYSL